MSEIIETGYGNLINYVKREGVVDIIKMAVEEFVPGFCGVVLYNAESGNFHSYCWTNGTSSGCDTDIEVFRVDNQTFEDPENQDEIDGLIHSSDIIEKNILTQLEYEAYGY